MSIVVRDGALWFSQAAGDNVGCISVDGVVSEYAIPTRGSQPRAMSVHPDGSIWFVQTSANSLGRIDRDGVVSEHPVTTPEASLRGVATSRDGEIWATENFANKIAHMAADGRMIAEYTIPTADSGARCIMVTSRGRIFFTQHDSGSIGEVIR